MTSVTVAACRTAVQPASPVDRAFFMARGLIPGDEAWCVRGRGAVAAGQLDAELGRLTVPEKRRDRRSRLSEVALVRLPSRAEEA